LPINKTLTQETYLRRLYEQCRMIGLAVMEWAHQAVIERSQQSYRAIAGVVNLARRYPYEIVNQACRQSLEKGIFNYHVVKEQAESLLAQKQFQQEIPFIQESDMIRLPSEYQKILSKESTWTN